jgi:predicted nucleotidyltransferase
MNVQQEHYWVNWLNKINMNLILKNNLDKIASLCKEHHVKKMYAFGSSVRKDFTENSDVDLLYEMDFSNFNFENLDSIPYDPFLNVFELKEKLEALLQKKVDLIPNQAFKNKFLKASIEKDKTLIYGAA